MSDVQFSLDVPHATDEEVAREFYQSARRAMQEREQEWRAAHRPFAWIDPEPVWMPTAEWRSYYPESGFLSDPVEPCKRIIRFSLPGGGQIRVTERWRFCEVFTDNLKILVRDCRPGLFARVHTDNGLLTSNGFLDGVCFEMSADAVVLYTGAQDIADKIATTLRAIDGNAENFYALLDGSEGCAFCGRPLRDEVSKLVGVGPDCARQQRIPRNIMAANKRLELRRKLLGEASS